MTDKINEYIKEQSCATVCCVDVTGDPYCFNCFYAYNSNERLLYYKSSGDTQHSAMILKNPAVAGTILPDKLNKLLVKGMQFEGFALPVDHPLTKHAAAFYYKKNPVAVAMPGEIWTIQINSIKLTDSSLGFGKKISWKRNEQTVAL
ncbi:MAG: pyridoxamine 5'-phosphate oxidase family protein [Chitinophagaceae bacterium]|nr:pyridoxamine 5'-phosphate oxidase family protein [Chitinophagaceae bacterium]